MDEEYCTQCGEATKVFVEGYCSECQEENQSKLDAYNHNFDEWAGLDDSERKERIRRAVYERF